MAKLAPVPLEKPMLIYEEPLDKIRPDAIELPPTVLIDITAYLASRREEFGGVAPS